MSYPHDYYHYPPEHWVPGPNGNYPVRPELHNRGEGRHYLEPDWHANDHDAQLPALSTIGRGPRGEGLYVGASVNQDGVISFTLNSTLTGEVVWESPNLAPWEIEFKPTVWKDIVAGIPAILDIKQTRGSETHTTHAYIPPGEEGSLIFVLDDQIQKRSDNTYNTTVDALTIYGYEMYQNRPTPRPNDIVMCGYYVARHGAVNPPILEHGLAIGTIENVGGTTRENYNGRDNITPTNVVFTVNNYIPIQSMPSRTVIRVYGEDFVLDEDNVFKAPIDYDAYDIIELMKNGDSPIVVVESREHPEYIQFSFFTESRLNGDDDLAVITSAEFWVQNHEKFLSFGSVM